MKNKVRPANASKLVIAWHCFFFISILSCGTALSQSPQSHICIALPGQMAVHSTVEPNVDSLKQLSTRRLVELIKTSSENDARPYQSRLEQLTIPSGQLAKHYFDLGDHFYKNENFDRSLSYYSKAVEYTDTKTDPDFLQEVYLGLGNASLLSWKNPEALETYHQLYEIALEHNNINYQIIAKSNIAIVLRRMKQLDKALVNCRELLEIINDTSFKGALNHVNILTITCEVYLDLQKHDSVMYFAQRGIEISESINYQMGLIDLHTKKGIVWYYKGELAKALQELSLARNIMIAEGISTRSHLSMNVNYFLASYYYDIESYDTAIYHLKEITKASEKEDLKKTRVADAYFLLAKCYYETGNEEQSIVAFSKYDELKKLLEKDKDRTITKIHDTGTQNLREKIELLETEKLKAGQTRQYVTIGLLISSLIAAITSLLFFLKQRSNKKKFKELVEQITYLESQREEKPEEPIKEATKDIPINDEKVSKVLQELDKLENQEYYLRVDCNLREMAKKVKTNSTYLSKIINKHRGKNFNDYIRDLRIDYVLKRLKNDKKFRSYSIKFIALEIGYKSDNSFTKHFRAKTKLNPSYYIKNIDKLGKV